MEDGIYQVEFENIEGVLVNAGTVVVAGGHFEGGTGGYYYVGTVQPERPDRFRAGGSVTRLDSRLQKCLGVFGDECSEFEVVLIGEFDGEVIKGIAARLDRPQITVRFRLTPESPNP